uniref:NIF3-like protein 1 n=1 Tax=Crassostrea virginica TaxID=6565 RepID=A0A8B8EB30_CRAVI|nr:NIF3-like protein 1 isoform X1 [Crassostrea virginica]
MAVNSQAATFDDMYGFLKFKRFPSPYSKNQKDVLRRRSKKFKIGDDDTLYFNSDGKELIVVRNSSLYHKIFEECHSTETGAHLGRDKTMSRVRERYYWPHMAIFIAQKVKECNKCQRGSAQSADSAQSATDSGNKNGTSTPLYQRKANYNSNICAMELTLVVKKLKEFADPNLAESWDNVGLLVEPTAPHMVKKVMLTNDLTEAVYQEARAWKANLIISYHPPIFVPMKKLVQSNWKDRIITGCLENRIAVFSPHTSYDAVAGGVNDWLLQAFDVESSHPVTPSLVTSDPYNKRLQITVDNDVQESMLRSLSRVEHAQTTVNELNEELSQINVLCCQGNISAILECTECFSANIKSIELINLEKKPKPGHGMGRIGKLVSPISVSEAVEKVKGHLGLSHVRLAKGVGCESISSVAVCAGSGSGLLKNLSVSLYVTGEMGHHDVLHAVQSGVSVILCDHSNTERGFLKVLQKSLISLFSNEIEFKVSKFDKDPLDIV